MPLLVVMVLVVLVQIAYILVIFFQSLPRTGGNPILFVLVDFGRRSRRTGRTLVAGRAIATATASAASAAAAAGIPFFASRIFDTAGPCRTIRGFCRRSFVQVDVVDSRQNVIPLQIGIEVQISIEFAGPRLFAENFIAPRNVAPWRWTVIAPWSGWTVIAAARIIAARLFAARRRRVITPRWGDVAAGGRGSFVPTSLGPPNLLAPLVASSSTLIAAATFAAPTPIGIARALFITRAGTFVSSRFGNWLSRLFLFQIVCCN